MNILYEDNHLLVVEKPINMPVQEDESKDKDLLTLLKEDIKVRYNKPGNVYVGLVHRLDRPVGGVMVFAKTSKAAGRLSAQVQERTMQKTYLAVVHGQLNQEKGTLQDFLLKDANQNKVQVVDKNTPNAQEAILYYRVLAQKGALALLEINLKTGRKHQIRVQFAHIGHPIFGDMRYGIDRKGNQIALWAHQLTFLHPTTQESLTFTSKPQGKAFELFHMW